MGRHLAFLTLDNLGDLSARCRSCIFWELDPAAGERAVASGHPGLEKEAWVSAMLLERGSCGQVVYADRVPAGHVLYAPPPYVPRSRVFSTGPASADAAVLTSIRVDHACRGRGLGRMLVHGMARDLLRRGVRAVEAFGDTRHDDQGCVPPVDFLLATGFRTVRPHHRHPRLRLDLSDRGTWHAEAEAQVPRPVSRETVGVKQPVTVIT